MTHSSNATEPPPTQVPGRQRRRRRAAATHRRARRFLAGIAIATLVLVVGAGLLAAFRYLPALDEARALRTDLEAMASRAQEAGLEVDRPVLDGLEQDLARARSRLDGLSDLLANDPLVALAQILPPTADECPQGRRIEEHRA